MSIKSAFTTDPILKRVYKMQALDDKLREIAVQRKQLRKEALEIVKKREELWRESKRLRKTGKAKAPAQVIKAELPGSD